MAPGPLHPLHLGHLRRPRLQTWPHSEGPGVPVLGEGGGRFSRGQRDPHAAEAPPWLLRSDLRVATRFPASDLHRVPVPGVVAGAAAGAGLSSVLTTRGPDAPEGQVAARSPVAQASVAGHGCVACQRGRTSLSGGGQAWGPACGPGENSPWTDSAGLASSTCLRSRAALGLGLTQLLPREAPGVTVALGDLTAEGSDLA